MKKVLIGLGVALSLMATTGVAKETPKPVQQHNSNAVWFENWSGLKNTSMTIKAPDGEIITIYAQSGTPVYQLSGDKVQDGIYRFELSAATEEVVKIVNSQNNGRGESAKDSAAVPYRMSGQFTVSRGVIVTPKDIKEE